MYAVRPSLAPWRIIMSSSFVRRTATHPGRPEDRDAAPFSTVKGCYTSGNTLLTSIGVPSLDRLLGGGMPVGAVLGVEEDEPRSSSNYASSLLKCAMAEGIVCGHHVIVLEGDSVNPALLLQAGLPAPTTTAAMATTTTTMEEEKDKAEEKMSIAWRYKHLRQLDQELPAHPVVGADRSPSMTTLRSFDLGKQLDLEQARKSSESQLVCVSSMQEDFVEQMLAQTAILLAQARRDRTVLRIILHSVGSPLQEPHSVKQLLYRLCAQLHAHPESCLLIMSTPAYALAPAQSELLADLESYCDITFSLRQLPPGTAGQNRALAEMYAGMMRFGKPPRMPGMLSMMVPETNDLAFKVRRRQLIFEPFHLPPDLSSESPSPRVAGAMGGGSGSTGCGSLKSLDF